MYQLKNCFIHTSESFYNFILESHFLIEIQKKIKLLAELFFYNIRYVLNKPIVENVSFSTIIVPPLRMLPQIIQVSDITQEIAYAELEKSEVFPDMRKLYPVFQTGFRMEIFSYFSLKEIVNLCIVSRDFNQLLTDPLLWQYFAKKSQISILGREFYKQQVINQIIFKRIAFAYGFFDLQRKAITITKDCDMESCQKEILKIEKYFPTIFDFILEDQQRQVCLEISRENQAILFSFPISYTIKISLSMFNSYRHPSHWCNHLFKSHIQVCYESNSTITCNDEFMHRMQKEGRTPQSFQFPDHMEKIVKFTDEHLGFKSSLPVSKL